MLDDSAANPDIVTRVLLCSGKVYYDLAKKRDELKTQAVAIVRLEQLYPWPEAQLAAVLGRYRRSREWMWVQEESQNMGGWSFAEPRLRAMGFPFEYVGRDASASPATGSHHVHEREQELIVEGAFAVTPPGAIGPGFVGWVESNGDGKTADGQDQAGRIGSVTPSRCISSSLWGLTMVEDDDWRLKGQARYLTGAVSSALVGMA